jgi:hypothetical protein
VLTLFFKLDIIAVVLSRLIPRGLVFSAVKIIKRPHRVTQKF